MHGEWDAIPCGICDGKAGWWFCTECVPESRMKLDGKG